MSTTTEKRHFKTAVRAGTTAMFEGIHTIGNALMFGHEKSGMTPLQQFRIMQILDTVEDNAAEMLKFVGEEYAERNKHNRRNRMQVREDQT